MAECVEVPVLVVEGSAMGRNVGKRSRFDPENVPRRELVPVSWGMGIRPPGCGCWTPIPNTFPCTICGWGAESKELASDVMSICGRGIFCDPLDPPSRDSEASCSVFPTFMRGTPNRETSFVPPGGGRA